MRSYGTAVVIHYALEMSKRVLHLIVNGNNYSTEKTKRTWLCEACGPSPASLLLILRIDCGGLLGGNIMVCRHGRHLSRRDQSVDANRKVLPLEAKHKKTLGSCNYGMIHSRNDKQI